MSAASEMLRVGFGVSAAVLLSRCTTPTDAAVPGADATPARPLYRFVEAGPAPDARTICGETDCPDPPTGNPVDERACCLPASACGVRASLLGSACLGPGQPGGVDLRCPSLVTPDGASVQGCCTPAGRCGHFDRFGDLGCVPASPDDAGQACHPIPSGECRSIVAIPCDGPEDCAPGNVCCARWNFGLYDRFGCFASCSAASITDRGIWRAVCHSTADCPEAADTCRGASGLPAMLRRCYPGSATGDAGGDASKLVDARIPLEARHSVD